MLVVQGDADNIRFSRSQTGNRRIPLKAACMSANDWRYGHSYGTGGSSFRTRGAGLRIKLGERQGSPRGEGGRDGGCGVAGKWLSLELGSGEEALQLESVDYQLLGSAVVRETFPHKWAPTGRDMTGADKPA